MLSPCHLSHFQSFWGFIFPLTPLIRLSPYSHTGPPALWFPLVLMGFLIPMVLLSATPALPYFSCGAF